VDLQQRCRIRLRGVECTCTAGTTTIATSITPKKTAPPSTDTWKPATAELHSALTGGERQTQGPTLERAACSCATPSQPVFQI
jgi:hypothetical protein